MEKVVVILDLKLFNYKTSFYNKKITAYYYLRFEHFLILGLNYIFIF